MQAPPLIFSPVKWLATPSLQRQPSYCSTKSQLFVVHAEQWWNELPADTRTAETLQIKKLIFSDCILAHGKKSQTNNNSKNISCSYCFLQVHFKQFSLFNEADELAWLLQFWFVSIYLLLALHKIVSQINVLKCVCFCFTAVKPIAIWGQIKLFSAMFAIAPSIIFSHISVLDSCGKVAHTSVSLINVLQLLRRNAKAFLGQMEPRIPPQRGVQDKSKSP